MLIKRTDIAINYTTCCMSVLMAYNMHLARLRRTLVRHCEEERRSNPLAKQNKFIKLKTYPWPKIQK